LLENEYSAARKELEALQQSEKKSDCKADANKCKGGTDKKESTEKDPFADN
jgi:hypothetical protein